MLSLLHKDHLIPSAAYGVICGWQSLLGYPDISVRNLCVATNANNNKLANVQDSVGKTGFHYVCQYGYSKIADLIVEKSTELNIDLNVKDFE